MSFTAKNTSDIQINVLFVCLGNICRSPSAEAVFTALASRFFLSQPDINKENNTSYSIRVDSCGTAAYHVGNPPDSRSISAAKKRGYDMRHMQARQLSNDDFAKFHYIMAMDQDNLKVIRERFSLYREQSKHKEQHCVASECVTPTIESFLGFARKCTLDSKFSSGLESKFSVPDPYYGDAESFEEVLDLSEEASRALLAYIHRTYFSTAPLNAIKVITEK